MTPPKGLPIMPWFAGDFLRSTRGWSVTAKGVYRELLDAQWEFGQLPYQPEELRALIGATRAEWVAGWLKCSGKFPATDDYRQNARLEEHRQEVLLKISDKSAAGRVGGLASAQARAQAAVQRPLKHSLTNGAADVQAVVNDPNKKKIRMSGSEPPDPVLVVFEHWQKVWKKPRSKLDTKRRKVIETALRSYDVLTLCLSIDGYQRSDWHKGQNDRRTVYDDIALFLRDAAHIDAGLKFTDGPPPKGEGPKTKFDLAMEHLNDETD
jgi:uncharacterized protein YdaU (DUF1376 family)